MSDLYRLLRAAQAVTPKAELHFVGIEDQPDWIVCTVTVGDVVLLQSQAAPLSESMAEMVRKLEKMSQRIHIATLPPKPTLELDDPAEDLLPPTPRAVSKPPSRY